MKHSITFLILACCLLPACNSATPTAGAEPITVQYTAAAAPWLADLYECAGVNLVTAEQRAANFMDPQTVNMAIRIGPSADLSSLAYQIGSEELVVILNPQNPINALTADQVRGLFTGQTLNWQEIDGSDTPVQVWVFSSGEDVEQIFEQTTLGGSPVTSFARLAMSMHEMAQAIAGDVNAVGVLPAHWKTENVADVFTIATVPVLALTPGEPQGAVYELIACLQK